MFSTVQARPVSPIASGDKCPAQGELDQKGGGGGRGIGSLKGGGGG